MLYYLFFHVLQRYFHALNVFRYITVRTALASLTALMIALVLGPWVIRRLREMQIGQFIREEGPKSHQAKAGTPTMGGVLIVASTVIPTLLWADLENVYVWLAVFTILAFGAIGFVDDYSKVAKRRNLGLTGKRKFSLQVLASSGVALTLLSLTASGSYSTQLSVPFFKNFHPELVIHSLFSHPYLIALAYLPFLIFVVTVIVGSSNAVNLTDGLDGLAIGCVVVAAGALTVLTYVTSYARFADYLDIQHLPEVGELTIFCGALVGSALGISLVQRASRGSVHGRRGIARAGRFHRDDRGCHQAGNPAVFCRRHFRGRGAFGDLAGRVVSSDGQAHFPDVAAPSPLRARGMERIENHRAFLDRGSGVCAVFADDTEIEVNV